MAKRSPIIQGDTALIPLTQGRSATIDVADLPLVEGYAWQAHEAPRTWYAWGAGNLKMHRVILGLSPGDPGPDHIDGDGLNNRRSNLRLAAHSLNCANQRPPAGGSSRFKGVGWYKRLGKWQAKIKVDYKTVYLGVFVNEEDAARAYDAAAIEAWGEFAYLNFPEEHA